MPSASNKDNYPAPLDKIVGEAPLYERFNAPGSGYDAMRLSALALHIRAPDDGIVSLDGSSDALVGPDDLAEADDLPLHQQGEIIAVRRGGKLERLAQREDLKVVMVEPMADRR